jgi:DNA-binding winged helix-turn-helix (wHTH) protein/Tol biopolymer transport system component
LPSSNLQTAAVHGSEPEALAFGRFVIEPQKRQLFEDGAPVTLTPKGFDTLAFLIAHRDRVVSKDELLESLWPDISVDEANLSQQIFTLRKLLGDNATDPRFIATAPRRGYRFVAPVRLLASTDATAAARQQLQQPSVPLPGRRWTRAALGLVALLALLATAAVAGWLTRRQPAEATVAPFKFSIAPPPGTTLPDNGGAPAVSPDGRRAAFLVRVGTAIGSNQLAIRRLDSTEVSLVAHTTNATSPFWSPDSRYLGYFAQAAIFRIDVNTMGPPVKIAETKEGWAASWGSRGTILISSSPRGGPLYKVAATGGEPTPVTTLDRRHGERAHLFAAFLPDGERFVYLSFARADAAGVYLGSLRGDKPRRLLTDNTVARYASGHLLYVTGDTLVAQPFDPVTAAFLGDPRPLVPMEVSNAGFAPFSASDAGVLIYGEILPRLSRLRWVDRAGRDVSPATTAARYMDPTLVGAGRNVLVAYHDAVSARPLPGSDVFFLSDGRSPRRLTSSPEHDYLPVSSPDGNAVAFSSLRSGGGDLYVASLDGAGGDRLLFSSPDRKDPTDWSTDGQYLLFENVSQAASSDVWYLRLDDRKPTPFLTSRANEWGARLSPDGRWLVYTSDESGRHEVHVRSFPDGRRTAQVSHEGARHPFWREDGAELFYLADNDTIVAVPFADSPQRPVVGAAMALFAVRPVRYTSRNAFVPAPDGARFLINERVEHDSPRDVKVIVNWSASAARASQ